jgi:choline dehydrogenase-like flavoprotein
MLPPINFGCSLQTWHTIHGSPPSREGLTIFPVLLHPRSRGTIRLKSADPEEAPLINPNYLSDEADVKILAEGIATMNS